MHPHAMMKVGRVAAISRTFSLLIFPSSSGRTGSAAAGIFSVRSAARGRISRGFGHVRAILVTWHVPWRLPNSYQILMWWCSAP
ncbi:hypothetical protein CFRS1_v011705 [Colletotrichum fructicola]|nr:hypothetical protein CFRS1_v011705 [Colletotrichum fructicola]